ncbi:auxin response factor 4-like [Senna tora]|uniref:Auxin response factor n=1 Tax=Senna tora TaxID=362788 RepID=A0A834TAJ7_9FABA|nr:auxin response factor 4-like [Senna tora]
MRDKRRIMDIAIAAASNQGGAATLPEAAAQTPTSNYDAAPLQDVNDDLYKELWQACAGPSVKVPRMGELVFYFPQGHLEQVAALIPPDGQIEIPVYDLPSKILCRVLSVHLMAEAYSDEVFAQITLLPESNEEALSSVGRNSCLLPSRTTIARKTLTQSDTSTHGGFSIPKRLADECFPPLDLSQQPPSQDLVVKDLHGFIWNFRHIYRGQPKRHLLTSGWSTFVNSKKLVAGDTCIFVRGEDGQLRIGIRRARKQHNNASTSASVISGHSMQLGILTSASFAIGTGTRFIAYYHPWTNSSEFIIPLDHYMKSTKMEYSFGMRVQMQCEAEESTKRYTGIIMGIDDIDGVRWPRSEWRCLKVQWDGMPETYMRPDRVSPWNIEPLDLEGKKIPNLPPPKKPRVVSPSLPVFCRFTKDDIDLNSVKHASQRSERDLQGQDYNEVGSQLAEKLLLTDARPPSNAALYDPQLRMTNQLHFQLQSPLCHSLGSSVSFPDDNISTSSLPKQPPIPTTYEACKTVSVTRYFSPSKGNSNDSESQVWRASDSRDENEVPFGQPGSYGRFEYKLFGVSLNNPELPSPQVPISSNTSNQFSVPPMSQSSISATIPVTSQKKCKKCCSVSSRSCTKVLKHGSALGRSIDLTRISGYAELISELDSMFDFKGSLIDGSSGWNVISIDDDGDLAMFGDYPWQDFQRTVQKMIIRPREETNNLNAIIASTTDSTTLNRCANKDVYESDSTNAAM